MTDAKELAARLRNSAKESTLCAVLEEAATRQEAQRLGIITDDAQGMSRNAATLRDFAEQALSAADALEAQAAEIEAQNAKLVALGLAQSCACSVDAPGEVCVHHSPLLTKAHARISALEQAAAPVCAAIRAAFDDGNVTEQTPDDLLVDVVTKCGDFRALARAAGGGE